MSTEFLAERATGASTTERGVVAPPPPAPPGRALAVDQPLHLLWLWVLPQVILLGINLRSFGLVWEEMVEAQRMMARVILGGEAFLLATGAGVAFGLRALGKRLDLRWGIGLVSVAVAYLWYATSVHVGMIPEAVRLWILRPDDFLYYQHMLVTPAVVHGLLLMTETEHWKVEWQRKALAVVAAVFILGVLCASIFVGFFVSRAEWLFVTPWVLAGMATVAGFMRLIVWSYGAARRTHPATLAIFTGAVAVVLPLIGLWVNSGIGFPVNFQSGGVYALTLLNGALLCLPNFRSIALHRAVWLAQAVTFPFTVYFCVVFLPFLALALPAMLVAGAGFLVLTPMALFLLHGGRLLDGLRNEVRDGGALRPALALVAAVLVLPVGITTEALMERRVLSRALDFAYDADRGSEARFDGNVTLVKWSLERLQDRQEGIVLPFLTDFYDAVVFNGLALPAEKVSYLARFYLGAELPERKSGLFSSRRGAPMFRERVERPQTSEVTMTKLESATKVEGGSARTRVTVEMRNAGVNPGEFVAPLRVPEGVLVSGFGLKIGTEMVPGRIVEKKTAMWVYQKIRDVVRRDPGLLVYTGPETLELRVFPLAANETRVVEMEFLSPAAMQIPLEVKRKQVMAGSADAVGQTVVAEGADGGVTVLLPEKKARELPAMERRPYLHFIVDRSAASKGWKAEEIKERMTTMARQFPAARECVIEASNFERATVSEWMGVEGIKQLEEKGLMGLPARGGLAMDRAVKGALLRYEAQRKRAGEEWARRYPVVVVLRASLDKTVMEGGLENFGALVPGVAGYWESTAPTGKLQWHPWMDGGKETTLTPAEVTVGSVAGLRCGGETAVVTQEGGGLKMVSFAKAGEVEVYSQATKSWARLEPVARLGTGEAYSRGLAVWEQSRARALNPSKGTEGAKEMMAKSRAERIMVPESSFIVVESAAQWKVLDEKEKQKLSANQALEMEAVPEAASGTLLALAGAWCLGRRWRRGAGGVNSKQ